MLKCVFDFFFAGIGLILLSPALLIIGFIIRKDGGPAFFRQDRIGLNGQCFRIFKFRTMVTDAEKIGSQITAGTDPRITKIGHFLRDTKIDELPQLINVVIGDMSLVGPRPEVGTETAEDGKLGRVEERELPEVGGLRAEVGGRKGQRTAGRWEDTKSGGREERETRNCRGSDGNG